MKKRPTRFAFCAHKISFIGVYNVHKTTEIRDQTVKLTLTALGSRLDSPITTPNVPDTAAQPPPPQTLRSRSESLSCTLAEVPALSCTLAKSRSCCGGSPCATAMATAEHACAPNEYYTEIDGGHRQVVCKQALTALAG